MCIKFLIVDIAWQTCKPSQCLAALFSLLCTAISNYPRIFEALIGSRQGGATRKAMALIAERLSSHGVVILAS